MNAAAATERERLKIIKQEDNAALISLSRGNMQIGAGSGFIGGPLDRWRVGIYVFEMGQSL